MKDIESPTNWESYEWKCGDVEIKKLYGTKSSEKISLTSEYLSTNLHMNRYASFFKGCRFKNTIVDRYSVVALKNQHKINKKLNAAETWIFYTVL